MIEFAFDMTLTGALRINAKDETEARAKLARYLDCADTNFGADDEGNPLLGEVSLDTSLAPSVYEIDGEAV